MRTKELFTPIHMFGHSFDYEEEQLRRMRILAECPEKVGVIETHDEMQDRGALFTWVESMQLPSQVKFIVGSFPELSVTFFAIGAMDTDEGYKKFRQTLAKISVSLNAPLLKKKASAGWYWKGISRNFACRVDVFGT